MKNKKTRFYLGLNDFFALKCQRWELEDILNGNYKFKNIKEFLDYPVIEIPKEYIKKVENGNKIENVFNIDDKVIFTKNNKDLAIYENKNNNLYPLIIF